MTFSDQKNQLNSADATTILEELRLVRAELQALKENVKTSQRREKLFGEWIHEKELTTMIGYSRSGLYNLWKQGLITKSTISGKANYYRMSDFKKLLDKNEYQ